MGEEGDRHRFVRHLIQLFRSLDQGEARAIRRYEETPRDFGWQETEEEYQQAQAEWLRRVEEKRARGESIRSVENFRSSQGKEDHRPDFVRNRGPDNNSGWGS